MSESLSNSVSMSESLSNSVSMSESLSNSVSMSGSLSNSVSMSESLSNSNTSTSTLNSHSVSQSLIPSETPSTSLNNQTEQITPGTTTETHFYPNRRKSDSVEVTRVNKVHRKTARSINRKLPQTGAKNDSGLLGIVATTLGALLGLRNKKRKNRK